MTADAPRLLVVADDVEAAAGLFMDALETRVLPRVALTPPAPFHGELDEALGVLAAGEVVGFVVPGVWRGSIAQTRPPSTPPLLAVRDHVNLALRGPLTGRWPPGVPRSFPCMTGVYQPSVIRAMGGASIYSDDVVVAGVADVGRLTPFELAALDEAGAAAYADCLVPAVIVAAFHGLKVAACVVPQAARKRE